MIKDASYKINSMKKQTADTISFTLKGENMDFKCGQFLMLEFPNLNSKEDPKLNIKRAYSIASDPIRAKNGEIELCVKEMPSGFVSKYLQGIKLGEEIKVSGPYGRFLFDPTTDEEIVMLAAGSGIAPFHCFLEHIHANKSKTNACLIFSNKTKADIIYRKELNMFSKYNENISVHYTLTRAKHQKEHQDNENAPCIELIGRIDKEMIQKICHNQDLTKKIFFICGPLEFVKAMQENLSQLNVKKENIRFESYG